MGHCGKTGKKLHKRGIMTMYLNKFEFINGAHGIEPLHRYTLIKIKML